MGLILYKKRSPTIQNPPESLKKRKKDRKAFRYPENEKIIPQTFQINYQKKLSSIEKSILNSFQKKYIYYAIDDILDSLKENPSEQENLLAILYSPILSLQNNFSINFFDIWIDEIYIEEIFKINKFVKDNFETLKPLHFITIKLFYQKRVPVKKQEFLW